MPKAAAVSDWQISVLSLGHELYVTTSWCILLHDKPPQAFLGTKQGVGVLLATAGSQARGHSAGRCGVSPGLEPSGRALAGEACRCHWTPSEDVGLQRLRPPGSAARTVCQGSFTSKDPPRGWVPPTWSRLQRP